MVAVQKDRRGHDEPGGRWDGELVDDGEHDVHRKCCSGVELVIFVADPSPLVRESITYGLARHVTETWEAIVALRALRTHDAAEDVRRSAAQKLAELGMHRLPGVDVADGILGDKDSRSDAN